MNSSPIPAILPVGEFILGDVLDEYSGKFEISGQSKILISNSRLADVVKKRFPGEVGQWQPTFTYTSDLAKADGSGVLQGPSTEGDKTLKQIEITSFTHAIISINTEDGRAAFRLLKWVHWALVPKGLLIVVVPTKDTLIDAAYSMTSINREEVMWQMTPARPPILDHAMRKASFEPSKIRILERTLVTKNRAEIDSTANEIAKAFQKAGEEGRMTGQIWQDAAAKEVKAAGGLLQEAYVILARRWDQLTA